MQLGGTQRQSENAKCPGQLLPEPEHWPTRPHRVLPSYPNHTGAHPHLRVWNTSPSTSSQAQLQTPPPKVALDNPSLSTTAKPKTLSTENTAKMIHHGPFTPSKYKIINIFPGSAKQQFTYSDPVTPVYPSYECSKASSKQTQDLSPEECSRVEMIHCY